MNISFKRFIKTFLTASIKAFSVLLLINPVIRIYLDSKSSFGIKPLSGFETLEIFIGTLILFWNSSKK
jgi:hypothetical protein